MDDACRLKLNANKQKESMQWKVASSALVHTCARTQTRKLAVSWKVKDGKLCNTYKKPKPRDGGCDKFYKTDDGEYIYTTGSARQGSFDKIIEGRHPE